MTVKICCISDTHGRQHSIDIEACDLLLHAGDLTMNGEKYETLDALAWLESLPAKEVCWIAGNHDRTLEVRPRWLQDRLEDMKPHVHYLQDSGVELFGTKIWGTPWQPEFFNWAFNLPRGEKLAEKYKLIPWDTDILLSHGPPYGIEDSIPERFRQPGQADLHVGCQDLLAYLKSPKDLNYHIFGHIHVDGRKEIREVDVKIDSNNYGDRDCFVHCINAAVVDNNYKVIVKPFYFNYETL